MKRLLAAFMIFVISFGSFAEVVTTNWTTTSSHTEQETYTIRTPHHHTSTTYTSTGTAIVRNWTTYTSETFTRDKTVTTTNHHSKSTNIPTGEIADTVKKITAIVENLKLDNPTTSPAGQLDTLGGTGAGSGNSYTGLGEEDAIGADDAMNGDGTTSGAITLGTSGDGKREAAIVANLNLKAVVVNSTTNLINAVTNGDATEILTTGAKTTIVDSDNDQSGAQVVVDTTISHEQQMNLDRDEYWKKRLVAEANTREEETKVQESKTESEKAPVILDPANIVTGSNEFSLSDFSYNSFGNTINLRRKYISNNNSSFSLGRGWTFNYDTRILYGVEKNYQKNVDEANKVLTDTRSAYNSLFNIVDGYYHNAKDLAQSSIDKASLSVENSTIAVTNATAELATSLLALEQSRAAKDYVDTGSGKTAAVLIADSISDTLSAYNKAVTAVTLAQSAIDNAVLARAKYLADKNTAQQLKNRIGRPLNSGESLASYKISAGENLRYNLLLAQRELNAAQIKINTANATVISLENNSKTKNMQTVKDARTKVNSAQSTVTQQTNDISSRITTCATDYNTAVQKYNTASSNWTTANNICKSGGTGILKLNSVTRYRDGLYIKLNGDPSNTAYKSLYTKQVEIVAAHNAAVVAYNNAAAYYIENYTEPALDVNPDSYTHTANGKLVYAKRTLVSALERKADAVAFKTMLKAEEVVRNAEVSTLIENFELELARVLREKSLAVSNEVRNISNTDPNNPEEQFNKNNQIKYYDENGIGTLFQIIEAPDYLSTTTHSDGSMNYYPNGSELKRITYENGQQILEDLGSSGETLSLNNSGEVVITKKDNSKTKFSDTGRLSKFEDKNGNIVSFDFKGRKISTITDSSGKVIEFTYSGNKITSVTDPLGRVSRYQYSDDYLTEYIDPEGNAYGYIYNNGLMIKKTTPENGFTTFEYTTNSNGKVMLTKAIDSMGNNWRTSYNPDNNYTIGIDRDGYETYYFYNNNKKTVEERYSDGTSIFKEYDLKGNVIAEINEKGYRTTFAYDSNNNLLSVSNPLNATVEMSYDSKNNITSIIDGNGNRTSFAYDNIGNLLRKDYTNGAYEAYTYYSNGSLKTSRDPLGNTSTYEYNSNGYLNQVTYPDNSFINIVSDVVGQAVNITDENGETTQLVYNNLGKVIKATDALGAVTQYQFNDSGKIQKVIDALNNSVNFEYDSRKNLHKQTDSLGNIQLFDYTPEDALASTTMPDGSKFNYSYDSRGRMTETTQVDLNISTIYEYDQLGNITKKIDALGRVYGYVYDVMSRLVEVIDPEGGITKLSYDKNNNVVSKTDANGNISTFNYDNMNRLNRVTDADGNYSTYIFDLAGNLKEQSDAAGNTTSYVYDNRNRLVKVTDANSNNSTFEYDSASRLLKETNAQGNSTTYSYNSLGKVINVTNALSGSKSFTYDVNGNLLTATNENGSVVNYQYDALNRVVKTVDPDGNESNFEYNYSGKVTKVTDALNNSKTFVYDVLGRLTVSTDEVGAVKEYTYDKNGNLLNYKDSLGKVTTFNYDKLGRVQSRSNPLGETESYQYDALGNVVETTDAKGYKLSYKYDRLNRLVKEINQTGSNQTFDYNSIGQLTDKNDYNGNSFTYQYDNVGRMLKELLPDGDVKNFTYDSLGNLTKAADSSSELEYQYDALNRLVNVKDNNLLEEITYAYDAVGNRTNVNWLNDSRDIKYTYGNRNEILSVTDDERKKTTFEYDALGREITRNLPNYTKMFKEYNPAGRLTSIKNTDRRNRVLGAEAYMYNVAGQRIYDIDEDGAVRTYEYDDAGRLIQAQYPVVSRKMTEDFTERVSQGLYPTYVGTIPMDIEDLGIVDSTTDIKSLLNITSDIYKLESAVIGLESRDNWVTDNNNSGVEYNTRLELPSDKLIEMMASFDNIGSAPNSLNTDQLMWTEKFSYDANSNLVNKANGWGSIDYTYNSTNSMLTAGNRSFNYDNNGNMLTESLGSIDTTYSYNVNNRVTDVFTKTGKFNGIEADPYHRGVEFGYDVFGRRNSRIEYNNQTAKEYLVESNEQTLYDGFGINPLADFVDNSLIYGESSYYAGLKPQMEYVRANSSVISTGQFTTTSSRPRVNNRSYMHQDILGSTMMVTSRTGSVTSRYNYDAFGNAFQGNFVGNTNKLGYNGKEYDPVAGIYNYGFRDYSSRLARFTTVDPIRDGNNWYVYCGNDFINYTDPNGLSPVWGNDINGDAVIIPIGMDIKEETSIEITRRDGGSREDKEYYNDTLEVKIGSQTIMETSVQSEADIPEPSLTDDYNGSTLAPGTYEGNLISNSGSYLKPIQLVDDYLIHPDQFTRPEKILDRLEDNKTIGPWNDPYSAGCQVVPLEGFDLMTETLEGLGFEYDGSDSLDVTIKEDGC